MRLEMSPDSRRRCPRTRKWCLSSKSPTSAEPRKATNLGLAIHVVSPCVPPIDTRWIAQPDHEEERASRCQPTRRSNARGVGVGLRVTRHTGSGTSSPRTTRSLASSVPAAALAMRSPLRYERNYRQDRRTANDGRRAVGVAAAEELAHADVLGASFEDRAGCWSGRPALDRPALVPEEQLHSQVSGLSASRQKRYSDSPAASRARSLVPKTRRLVILPSANHATSQARTSVSTPLPLPRPVRSSP